MKPFRLDRSDVAAWVHLPREATGRRKFAIIVPLVIIGGALGFLDQESRPVLDRIFGGLSWGREAIVVSVAALLWFLVTTVVLTRIARKRIAEWRLPATETLVENDAAGVTVHENGQAARRRWETFRAATLGKEHVFLSAGEDDVLIIPVRAFEDRAGMAAFARLAEERIAEVEFETSST